MIRELRVAAQTQSTPTRAATVKALSVSTYTHAKQDRIRKTKTADLKTKLKTKTRINTIVENSDLSCQLKAGPFHSIPEILNNSK